MKPKTQLTIRVAGELDRKAIYRLRHEVYARELGQHEAQAAGLLQDALDEHNVYLLAEADGGLIGFISITPPGAGRFSLDKYISREEFPGLFDEKTFEVRLLTIARRHRGRAAAYLLMYAAMRWVAGRRGTRMVGMGRREVMGLYRKMGLRAVGREIRSGRVTFELMTVEMKDVRNVVVRQAGILNRLERVTDWRLDVPFHELAGCFHGGAFFDAVGPEFDHLERRHSIINADVLDAWFPPSPKVIEALRADLGWLLQTSPPTDCGGLLRAIARARGVAPECILPGAGSSDLIFLAFQRWLTPESRVLLPDPTYGEYAHMLEQVIRCRVERFPLRREDGYQMNLARLQQRLHDRRYDLLVLVNPNSPTGRHVPRSELDRVLERAPTQTRVWLDETYVDYVDAAESVEPFAANTPNVVVCKSMSKVYALSGARVAYLCGGADVMMDLRSVTPPWAVSLPAQIAAVRALGDPGYYAAKQQETTKLRIELQAELARLPGWEVIPGSANFILCHAGKDGPDAAEIVRRCRERSLFLRDASNMGSGLGRHAVRIAVKDAETNFRMLAVLRGALWEPSCAHPFCPQTTDQPKFPALQRAA